MTIERELLWNAYPEGILAKPGVGTVGGWRCVEVAPFGSVWCGRQVDDYRFAILGGDTQRDPDGLYERRSDWRLGMDTFRAAIDLGDLLPDLNLDTEPGTWAWAKRDLAAAGPPLPFAKDLYRLEPGDLMWFRGPHDHWNLVDSKNARQVYQNISADNPAIALAMARARLHKEGR